MSADLDQNGIHEGYADQSQLSTIFEEAFPDLSDDMLSVPELHDRNISSAPE